MSNDNNFLDAVLQLVRDTNELLNLQAATRDAETKARISLRSVCQLFVDAARPQINGSPAATDATGTEGKHDAE